MAVKTGDKICKNKICAPESHAVIHSTSLLAALTNLNETRDAADVSASAFTRKNKQRTLSLCTRGMKVAITPP